MNEPQRHFGVEQTPRVDLRELIQEALQVDNRVAHFKN